MVFKMQLSSKIFPAIVFLLVVGASLTLLLYPELVYEILIWVIGSFQAGGLPLLFVMMIIQALAIPIPSELVLIAGGLAFGVVFGWLVGALGSIVAAILSFYISRKGGRSLAIRFVGEKGIKFADNWFNRWGAWAVLLGRFAPFIPFDAISYSAGLTTMKLKNFMIPTIIGTLPRALFYASLGGFFGVTFQELIDHYRDTGEIPQNLQKMLSDFNYVLLGAVAVIAAIFVVYWLVTRKYTAEKETKSI
ncbi:MAG: VTT domain-containing protein [Candidatus Bathyarchaeota archaeon]|nr:VTT domain-containing protein [Candidatus Bathyarchaeota archaeon]